MWCLVAHLSIHCLLANCVAHLQLFTC